MKNYKKHLFHQTPLKILSFLALRPEEIFSEGEIRKATQSSIGSTNQILRLLVNLNVVCRETKGNLYLYKLNSSSQIIKYFKIFEILLYIHEFVEEVAPFAYEVILYGSCAQGTNTQDSDIDVFINTEYKSKVRKIVNKYRAIDENFKAVIIDPLEIASSKKADEVFYNEVKKGITLWKGKPTYEEI